MGQQDRGGGTGVTNGGPVTFFSSTEPPDRDSIVAMWILYVHSGGGGGSGSCG